MEEVDLDAEAELDPAVEDAASRQIALRTAGGSLEIIVSARSGITFRMRFAQVRPSSRTSEFASPHAAATAAVISDSNLCALAAISDGESGASPASVSSF